MARLGWRRRRIFRSEPLEERSLLAWGDFIRAVEDPSTTRQLGSESGSAVAAAGDTIVVAAPLDDALGYTDIGQVHLYSASSGALLRTIANPTRANDGFGQSVALAGQMLAVGAPSSNLGEPISGVVHLFNAENGALLRTIRNPTPAANDNFGTALALSADRLVVGAYLDDSAGTDTGAAYVFDLQTGELLQTLVNPSDRAFDYFGFSVAIQDETVVVGAARVETGATDSGATYIFHATSGELIRSLSNPSPANFDYFGHAVAITGTHLVVTAYRDGIGASSSGAAYIYDLTSGDLQHTIANPTPAFADFFGGSLAAAGDSVLIGARRADRNGATDSGVAYQFSAVSGALTHTYANPTPKSLDYFGSAVALTGDVAVIGAYWDDTSAPDAGTVYLYNVATGAPTHALSNPTLSSLDYFGYSLAVDGNFVVIGAPLDDAAGTDSGAAYVYDARTGEFVRSLTLPAPESQANFGNAVAVDGNLAVIGAYRKNSPMTDSGAAYVFDIRTGELLQTLLNPTPAPFDYFGYSVSIAAGRVAVGAHLDETGASDAGSAYVFDAITGELLLSVPNPSPLPFDNFGYTVAISEELMVVGSRGTVGGLAQAGSVFVIDLSSGALLQEIVNPDPVAADLFGQSLAASGTTVVVGAPRKDLGAVDAGAVYVYQGLSGELLRVLEDPVPSAGSLFGYSLAMSGQQVAVGAYQKWHEGKTSAGAAFLFNAANGQMLAEFTAPEPAANEFFGWSVAIDQDYFIVGTPLHDGATVDRGAVYLFDVHQNALPVPMTDSSYVAREGEMLTFDASTSFDVEDPTDALLFEWDLDYDGTSFQADLTGVAPSTSFAQSFATRTFALRVSDTENGAALITGQLRIDDALPILTVENNAVSGSEGTQFTNQGTFLHPVQEPITLTASVGTITQLENNTWTWEYTPLGVGHPASVTITATDSSQQSVSQSFALDVVPILPLLTVLTPNVEGRPGDTVTQGGTISHPAGRSVVLTTSLGTVVDQGDGNWTWSYTSDAQSVSQVVTITATDSANLAQQTTFLLNLVENGPLVAIDSAEVVVSEGALAENLGDFGHSGSQSVTISASVGSVSDEGNGRWRWQFTPTSVNDAQTVTITVTDSDQRIRAATFALRVTAVAPVVTAQHADLTVDAGTAATNNGTFTHGLGKSMTLQASIGEVIDSGDGTWQWSHVPTNATVEPLLVVITATDSSGQEGSVTFSLVVNTQIPVVLGDLNRDGAVDASDAAIQFGNWGSSGQGDLNEDGVVDAADAGLMFANWTGDSQSEVFQAIAHDVAYAAFKLPKSILS